jgi:hypothetical protein
MLEDQKKQLKVNFYLQIYSIGDVYKTSHGINGYTIILKQLRHSTWLNIDFHSATGFIAPYTEVGNLTLCYL